MCFWIIVFHFSNTHSAADLEAVDIGVVSGSRPARSNPVNMPLTGGGTRPLVPVLIESGSCSKLYVIVNTLGFCLIRFHASTINYYYI